jgi:hypothetical protein
MSRSDILLASIDQFYANDTNATTFHTLVQSKDGGISLRALEHFITNYAKKTNATYKTVDGKIFAVHCSYKSSLDGYSKKLFDPFARSQKFEYTMPNSGEKIVTTVAQLNFIRWVIKNDIIKYLLMYKNSVKST